MGCGASTATVQPTQQRLRQVVPSSGELWEASQQQTISEAAGGPEVKRQEAIRKASAKHLAQRGSGSTVLSPEDEDEDSKPGWSSWDSSTWKINYVRGAPMPPDRRLHECHLCVLNRFQREVEHAPNELTKIVESRR